VVHRGNENELPSKKKLTLKQRYCIKRHTSTVKIRRPALMLRTDRSWGQGKTKQDEIEKKRGKQGIDRRGGENDSVG